MTGNLILTKESSPSVIECYFRGVLALDQQEKVFSVNLDDVWQLCYTEKSKAVRALKTEFIENVDFISLAKNGETATGGFRKIDYYLTSACLEYFIARKVRPVFEVYRRVFHKAAELAKHRQNANDQMQANLMFADWAIRTLNLNEASRIAWAQKISEKYGMVAEIPAAVNAGTLKPILHAATDLLKQYNVGISAKAFNRMLEIKGVVKQATRPGRMGKEHKWYVILPAFDKYGQNQQDPKYQQQTQIRWYDNTFVELLTIVGLNNQLALNMN